MQTRTLYTTVAIVAFGSVAFPNVALASAPRTHDGFFFQGSLGLGPGWLDEELSAAGETDELSMSGPTGKFELLFGGTPLPGLVVGGGLTAHSMMNPTVKINGSEFETEDVSIGLSQVSVFSQYYPDPRGGLYLHGSLGYGSASVTVNGEKHDTDESGVALGLGVGYGFWVGEEWSIGPQFRFTFARLTSEEDGREATSRFIAPTIAISATYH